MTAGVWSRRAEGAALLGLVALALWVRWPALAPSSLWLDDAWVAIVARADGPAQAALVSFTHPGFTAVVWAVTAVFGVGGLAAQLPALVAGLAGVVAAWWVPRRLGASPPAALVAATLVAVAPGHAIHSTRVKAYTLEVLAGFLLVWLAGRVLAQPDRSGRWVALVAGGLAATVVSASTAFLVAGAILALAVDQARRGWPQARSLAAAVGAYGLVAGPWWLLVSSRLTDAVRGYWTNRYLPVDDPGLAWSRFVDGTRIVVESLLPGPVAVTLPLLALAVVVALAGRRHRSLVAGFAAVPAMLVLAAALRLAPWGTGRTELLLLAPLALVVAVAVDEVRVRHRGAGHVLAGAVGALAVGAALVAPRAWYPQEDVRELVARADAADAPVLVYPSARWAHGLYTDAPVHLVADPQDSFGFRPVVDDPRVTVPPVGIDDPGVYAAPVRRAVDGADRVLLLSTHAADDLAALRDEVTGHGFVQQEVVRRPGARLFVYERAN